MKTFILSLLLLLLQMPVHAADKNPVPRFVSLRPNEVNARVGPGPEYPVEWIFKKAGLPVEVTAEFDTWRRIKDCDGDIGWVHQNMLCSKRRAIIKSPDALIYSQEDMGSTPLARLQEGLIVELLKCRGEWCRIQINDYKGWIQRTSLWGVYKDEVIG
jgi:SH3-like domain-containing protein